MSRASTIGPVTSPRIAVLGAGIVGTAIAYELRKRGADVALVDRDEPGNGCSFGNSGAISVSSVAPLAMPGVLASVPSMLLDPESPLRLPLRYLPRAAPWLLQFVASARPHRVEQAAKQLAALHAGAVDMHEAMARELGVPGLFLRRGHLHLYIDDASLAKDAGAWRLREAHGVRAERLDRAGIEALEPDAPARYQVAMFLADHATIVEPFRYVQAMARAFAANGGRVVQADVQRLESRAGGWTLRGAAGEPFTHAIVAAGAWSNQLVAPLGIHLALESQRGYHVQYTDVRDVVSRTVVLTDRKVFVTPMEGGLRVGGTVEIAGLRAPPDPTRAAVLDRIAREAFPALEGRATTTWMGHRPCMPNSVPVVGTVSNHPGLWIATGHGHLGLTDSLPTARRIADALLGEGVAGRGA
nr:FAD-dependent oxidoreductase [Ramlibacter algicola]